MALITQAALERLAAELNGGRTMADPEDAGASTDAAALAEVMRELLRVQERDVKLIQALQAIRDLAGTWPDVPDRDWQFILVRIGTLSREALDETTEDGTTGG